MGNYESKLVRHLAQIVMKLQNPKLNKHLKTIAIAATLTAAGAIAQADAATVGIHFTGINTYYNSTNFNINTASGAMFAGVAAQYWNNMAPIDLEGGGPLSRQNQLLTTTGATGIKVDYSASKAWCTYEGDASQLTAYRSYLDDSGAGYVVTIKGLSTLGSGYQLSFLQGTDSIGNHSFAGISIYDGTGTGGTLLDHVGGASASQFADGSGYYGTTLNTLTLNSDTITIKGDARSGSIIRSTLAGITITTVPEPGTGAFMIAAISGLMFVRRRKHAE